MTRKPALVCLIEKPGAAATGDGDRVPDFSYEKSHRARSAPYTAASIAPTISSTTARISGSSSASAMTRIKSMVPDLRISGGRARHITRQPALVCLIGKPVGAATGDADRGPDFSYEKSHRARSAPYTAASIAPTISSTTARISSSSSASAMTRISGSVPDLRISSRP